MKAFILKTGCRSQRGFVLLTALVMLLVLTLIALVAMTFESNQARVAGNTANAQIAYETADGALRVAEGNLLAGLYQAGTSGVYQFVNVTSPLWLPSSTTWTTSGGYIDSGFAGGSSQDARIIVEQLPSVSANGGCMSSACASGYGGSGPPQRVYRISSYAVGANGKSVVVVQSMFRE